MQYFIHHVKIIDGSNSPAYYGNVGIRDGRLVICSAQPSLSADSISIDGTGLTLCPGFIDSHSHSDLCMGADPHRTLFAKVSQGVTTEVNGQCGYSLFPIHPANSGISIGILGGFVSDRIRSVLPGMKQYSDYISYAGQCNNVTNSVQLVGHCLLRGAVMGTENRPATPKELDTMCRLLDQAMRQGAKGLSSGLVYIPGAYCDHAELTALCKVIAPYGGIYATHMRNEADEVEHSVADSIAIAREAGVKLVISHHKICGKQNWGRSVKTLEQIRCAHEEGVAVYLDLYPYHATMTSLDNCIPPQYMSAGFSHLKELLADADSRREITAQIKQNPAAYDNPYINTGGFHKIMVSVAPGTPDAVGKTVAEYADLYNMDPFDAYYQLLIDNDNHCMASFFSLSEDEMLSIYASPYAMIGSDSILNEAGGPSHPRAYGSFIRPLAEFALKRRLLPLEQAVYKQTGLTASVWNIPNKGLIRDGYDADLVLLDESKLRDMADFRDGTRPAQGVVMVMNAGRIIYENNRLTGEYPGRAL